MACVVFTDLDGTMLGHHNYEFEPAAKFIETLARVSIPLVLNTSKTYDEVKQWHKKLKLNSPFVFENGGGLYFNGKMISLGVSYDKITQTLNQLKNQFQFTGFSSMSVADVCAATNLQKVEAILAKKRMFTEPILWEDTEENLTKFKTHIAGFNLQCVRGGRFLHLQGYHDKATAMNSVLTSLGGTSSITIALGDSENDRSMLERVDHAIVMPVPGKERLSLNREGVLYAETPAPGGWVESLQSLLVRLGYL
jgi:mannosyl-3-phosphoglycerate phosphatase